MTDLETSYYEVSLVSSRALSKSNHDSIQSCGDQERDFLHLDFTVDLSSTKSQAESTGGVLCTFKPSERMRRGSMSQYMGDTREYPSTDKSVEIESGRKSYDYISNMTQVTQKAIDRPCLHQSIELPRRMTKNADYQEKYTPQPRSSIPQPLVVRQSMPLENSHFSSQESKSSVKIKPTGAAGVYSKLATQGGSSHAFLRDSMRQQDHPLSQEAASDVYFPSQVVLAQQMQIDRLTNQVEELKRLVLALGGNIGTNPEIVESQNNRNSIERTPSTRLSQNRMEYHVEVGDDPSNDRNQPSRKSQNITRSRESDQISNLMMPEAADENSTSVFDKSHSFDRLQYIDSNEIEEQQQVAKLVNAVDTEDDRVDSPRDDYDHTLPSKLDHYGNSDSLSLSMDLKEHAPFPVEDYSFFYESEVRTSSYWGTRQYESSTLSPMSSSFNLTIMYVVHTGDRVKILEHAVIVIQMLTPGNGIRTSMLREEFIRIMKKYD